MIETRATLDPRGEGLVMGRLGRELASLYGDTLQAPLPPMLRAIVERLEDRIAETSRAGHGAP